MTNIGVLNNDKHLFRTMEKDMLLYLFFDT